ncbi:MAG TPA: hypothetical protein EYP80_01890 [Candidatus Aenigmarchaeota archaeon]|nr:hypothetical protein [Candidatus Aenigmarchaeota archaeon]
MKSCEYFDKIVELLSPHFPLPKIPLLNPPASEDEIQLLESHISKKLPDDFRAVYLMHNGETDGNSECYPGLMCAYSFMNLKKIATEYAFWIETLKLDKLYFSDLGLDEFVSYPDGAIKTVRFDKGWVPFSSDGGGNFLAIDLCPDKRGAIGQVINFGRDDENLYQISRDFTHFLRLTLENYKNRKLHYLFSLDGDSIDLIPYLSKKFGTR